MFYKDEDLLFLKPSPELRELMILSHLENEPRTSQSGLSKYLGISVAMVNKYISRFSEEGIITVKGDSNRKIDYIITVKGYEKKRELLHKYMIETVRLYKDAKKEFYNKFESIKKEGIVKVVFYGAGETAEIAVTSAQECGLKVIALVDKQKEKQGKTLNGVLIVSPDMLKNMDYDCIIISSSGYFQEIYQRIKKYEKQGKKIVKL